MFTTQPPSEPPPEAPASSPTFPTPTETPTEERRPTTITISATPADIEGIDSVLEKVPLANRHAIAKASMKVGLARLRENPELVIEALRDGKVRITTRGGAR